MKKRSVRFPVLSGRAPEIPGWTWVMSKPKEGLGSEGRGAGGCFQINSIGQHRLFFKCSKC